MIKFRIFSTEVKIDFSFFMFMALIFMMNNPDRILLFFVSCIIHEMGHLIAMSIFNAESKSICISGLGIKILQSRNIMLNSGKSLIILICGPLINLIIYLFGINIFSQDFLNINMTLFLFNMLPFRNLDGGSIIVYIGEILNMERFFNSILKISAVVITLLMLCAVYFFGGSVIMGASIILYYCFSEIFL